MSSLLFPLLLVVAGVMSLLTIDFSVGRYFDTYRIDGVPERLLDAAEHFGTPFGQALILIVIGALSHWWEPRIIRIFLAASAAGLAADLLKLVVARSRPHSFEFVGGSTWSTFQDAWPLGVGGSPLQSFPSAHSASAAGFALALGWAYPSGRPVFAGLALLVGLHRIANAAHFPSDVCFGLAVGWAVAAVFVNSGPTSRKFDAWEKLWATYNPRLRNSLKVGNSPSDRETADRSAVTQ